MNVNVRYIMYPSDARKIDHYQRSCDKKNVAKVNRYYTVNRVVLTGLFELHHIVELLLIYSN